jgi:hypothetical protein
MPQLECVGGEDRDCRRGLALAGEDVENDVARMDAGAQRLSAGSFNSEEAIGQDRAEQICNSLNLI